MAPQSPTGSLPASQPTHSSSGSSGLDISPAGSPPLILAFLAIGIFSAAMIAVFGWRRVQYPREGGGGSGVFLQGGTGSERRFGARGGGLGGGGLGSASATAPGGGGCCSSRFGEKPVLWDLCTDSGRNSRVCTAAVDYGTWDNIMPFAVGPASDRKSSQDASNETLWSRGRTSSSSSSLTTSQRPSLPPPPSRPVLVYSILGPRALASRVSSSHHSSRLPGESPSLATRPRRQQQQRFDEITPLSILRRHVRGEASSDGGTSTANRREGNGSDWSEALEDPSQRHGGEADHGQVKGGGRKEIRIAVIIEMPSPPRTRTTLRRPLSESEPQQGAEEGEDKEEEDKSRGGAGQYCIGVHTCGLPVVAATPAPAGGDGKVVEEEKQIRSVNDDEK